MNEQSPTAITDITDITDKAGERTARRPRALAVLPPHPATGVRRTGHQRLRELRILRLVADP